MKDRGDCVLLALEAYARLVAVSPWVRIFWCEFRGDDPGHATCVFEMPDKTLWSYEDGGCYRLGNTKRNAKAIAKRLGKKWGSTPKQPHLLP